MILEMKDDFDGLINRLNIVEESVNLITDRSAETQLEHKEKKVKTITEHVSSVEQ